ncbi:branched-chain amino acid transporter permease [Halarcobacter sp.]|uniref:branched-chain amino acid transporter permease n=1 Tax=Halarcobacter TaxID=2321115 RepID=UPI003A956A85
MSSMELYIAIAIMAVVNFLTRVFPFVFFAKKDLPKSMEFIEKFFPATIMTILVFYTLKDVDFSLYPHGIKEVGGIVFTAFLHLTLKNYLVSIFLGTIFYMALVQYF